MTGCMKCVNNFQGDRICDMCSVVVPDSYKICKKDYDKRMKKQNEKIKIERNCEWRHILYDNDCVAYWACTKPGINRDILCIANKECINTKEM
jgi:hypothetical protein